MSTRLVTLCIDANDPGRLARFWAGALHWAITEEDEEGVRIEATDGTAFELLTLLVPEPKEGKNRIHLDLVAESPAHQAEMVDELVALGASPVDVGQPADVTWVVLADPEGNELCVILRGEFLATTGRLGAVVFEPASHELGAFWSAATGWPVVYDQDGDTAIRSPDGTGPFITFGPPVAAAKAGKNRLHLDVAPPAGADQAAEVDRLIALGAQRVDIGQGDVTWVVLADPDGNELCVLSPR